jgi:ATP synthase protein I
VSRKDEAVTDKPVKDETVAAARRDGPPEQNAGYIIFSYLLSGMLFYGVIGWLVARWTHLGFIFPLGMIAGLVLAIVLILYKYGRT